MYLTHNRSVSACKGDVCVVTTNLLNNVWFIPFLPLPNNDSVAYCLGLRRSC